MPKQAPGGATAAAPVVVATTAAPIPSWNPPTNAMKPKVETKIDISLFYQIFPEEILGSGQFGTVYGGEYIREGWCHALGSTYRDPVYM